jgi:hypothetical protein
MLESMIYTGSIVLITDGRRHSEGEALASVGMPCRRFKGPVKISAI